MRESVYKNYGEAKVLGVSPSSGYELMHQLDFPVLCVAAAWWCRKKSAFSGWRSIREVLYEVPTVAQTRSRQKLFQGPQ